MLWTICIILLVLWALGFFAFHLGSSAIHVLIVVVVIILIVRLLRGEAP